MRASWIQLIIHLREYNYSNSITDTVTKETVMKITSIAQKHL